MSLPFFCPVAALDSNGDVQNIDKNVLESLSM
jgi:hypothetical protein